MPHDEQPRGRWAARIVPVGLIAALLHVPFPQPADASLPVDSHGNSADSQATVIDPRVGEGKAAPERVVATRGTLYLGGHELAPPCTLWFHRGRLTINGLQIPPPTPAPSPQPPPGTRLIRRITAAVDSINESLRDSVPDDSSRYAAIAEALLRLDGVRSARLAGKSTLAITPTIGFSFGIVFNPGRGRQEASVGQLALLRSLKAALEKNAVVVISGDGAETVVPHGMRHSLEEELGLARTGGARDPSIHYHLTAEQWQEFRRPLALERVR